LPATGPSSVTLRVKGQPDLPAKPETRGARCRRDGRILFARRASPLLHGRTFTVMDNAATPRVIVVNQEFVRRHLQDRGAARKTGPFGCEWRGVRVGRDRRSCRQRLKTYSERAYRRPGRRTSSSLSGPCLPSLSWCGQIPIPDGLASALRGRGCASGCRASGWLA